MEGLLSRILTAALAAYLLGNLNGAVTVSSLLDRDDVRTHGSGNAGMTNYIRNYGLSKTGLVILLDLGKALLASYLGALLLEPYGYWMEGAMLAGVFVSLGHDYPVTLGFRGGKGILCGLGVALRCCCRGMCPWVPVWRRWLWVSASGCSTGSDPGWWRQRW